MATLATYGLLDYSRELDAYDRARLQRSMWDDRQVCDEHRYTSFAPRGPHYFQAKMCGTEMRVKMQHSQLDRPIEHTRGDKHGECSSELRTHRNFEALCAERLPLTPPKACSEAERRQLRVRLLAKDLAAEEKAAMRLRQKRERQRMAQAIVTPTAGLTHLQRQRSAREARSRALAPRVSSPDGLPRSRSPLLLPSHHDAAQPEAATQETEPKACGGDAEVGGEGGGNEVDCGSEGEGGSIGAGGTTLALVPEAAASRHEAWERWQQRFGQGSAATLSERQRAMQHYVPSMGDAGLIEREPAYRKLPGKLRLSDPRCEATFRGSLRESPRESAASPRHLARFRGALWPAEQLSARLPWGSGRSAAAHEVRV